jgi:signal transduction histidine kinase
MSNEITMVEDLLAVVTLVGAALVVVALWRRGRSDPEYVSLSRVATGAWGERVAHESAATLEIRFDQDLAIYADPRELSGVLTALLENAVDHGPSDGTVHLGRTDEGFYIADDGPGIPEPDREQVFELGYATRPDHEGLGLGLVQSVCESHDWTVRVTDSDSGGAKVVIENVDFLTDWDRDDSTTDDSDDGAGTDTTTAGTDADRPEEGSYITSDVADQSDTTGRVDRAEN